MYIICHVTSQDYSIEISCIYMGESSLQHLTTMKSLVIRDILIVKKKNASSKTRILYICTATEESSRLDNHQARKKFNNLKNVQLEKKCSKIKKHIFPLMTSFYNFTLKIETGWAKKFIKFILETWNVNDVIVYLWFRYLRIKKIKICNSRKSNFTCTKFTIKS